MERCYSIKCRFRSVHTAWFLYFCASVNVIVPSLLKANSMPVLGSVLDSLVMVWALLMPVENAPLLLISLAIHQLIVTPKSTMAKRDFSLYYLMGWSIYFSMVKYLIILNRFTPGFISMHDYLIFFPGK